MKPGRAVLCGNYPFRRSAPKAGELGGSVPAHPINRMAGAVHDVTEGLRVMQCHKTPDEEPRACAGFLSVVGYDSIGVRLAVAMGVVLHEDVGQPRPGLYGSFAEMLREADHLEIVYGEAREVARG